MEHISTENLIVVAIAIALAAGIPALLSRLPMRASYLTSIQRTCSFAR